MWYKVLIFMCFAGCSIRPLYDFDSCKNRKNNIYVSNIANREGQKLRLFLQNNFRDLTFVKEKYYLFVDLKVDETPFAIANDGDAQRLKITYIADFMLKNSDNKIIISKKISLSSNRNISTIQGDVMLSLYGGNNDHVLKELAGRIIESIKMCLQTMEKDEN